MGKTVNVDIDGRRNAPGIQNGLSKLVDVTGALVTEARAADLHPVADALLDIRAQLIQLARDLWRAEEGER